MSQPRQAKRFVYAATLLLFAGAAWMLPAQQPDTVPTIWGLIESHPGEPSWAVLFRFREHEALYRTSATWWDPYVQYRSQLEGTFGDHAAALRLNDTRAPSRDSVQRLPKGTQALDALRTIVAAADTGRVVMVNERHHAASDRLLTLQLLPLLRAKGYRYFAAEAFNVADTGLQARGYPIRELTGTYTDEPIFAAIVREALRLGYTLVPYESERPQEDSLPNMNTQQRRDSLEAANLNRRIFLKDPNAKVLVHAGYSHVQEELLSTWHPMAMYFRQLTGIDPITVDQTRLSERSAPGFEHPAYRGALDAGLLRDRPVILADAVGNVLAPVAFRVDFQVLTPRTEYKGGRPTWLTLGGRRVATDLATPECEHQVCVAEAYIAAEPDSAVVVDRAEIVQKTSVRLFLPRGQRMRVRLSSASGKELRTFTVDVKQ